MRTFYNDAWYIYTAQLAKKEPTYELNTKFDKT
jgi:hypothetical protein